MKKIVLILIFLLCAGLTWAYLNGPVSNIEYSFSEKGIGRFGNSIQPIKFALISDIHIRETSREEITPEKQTRTILKSFMTSMNAEVKPDFIVQLGDLNDGWLAGRAFGISNDQVVDRLRRAQKYTEEETDIIWFDVIGNHEYASGYNADLSVIENKDFSDVYRAINENWSSLEDTWYFRDIKGYRFIFLNTSYPNEGLSHRIPAQEVNWLRGVLESSDKPVFVFMHVPVSKGAGNTYDVAVNQEKIIELLAQHDSFVVGFFGHSHHSDKWDGLRKQFDHAGNTYFHIPAPHEWLGDRSSHPWVIVTVEPGEDGFSVEVGTGVKRSEITEFGYYLKEMLVKLPARLGRKFHRFVASVAGSQ
jgi:hypothetical protein